MNEQELIRNFAIIAHIDHGKSTLSDRFLELTKTIAKDKLQEQFLDQNIISRQRGITIKLAPVRMHYTFPKVMSFRPQGEISTGSLADARDDSSEYILNLIDTPGHVDFSYEVSRTLAACEGAVLLVDATQGIQAQTVAHYHAARKEGLVLVPAINKIDLPNAQTELVIKELHDLFGFQREEIILISAKSGENVELLLQIVIQKIPPPQGNPEAPLRALIFDAVYDEYRGVIAYTRVVDGKIDKGEKVQMYQNTLKTDVTEVGTFTPFLKPAESLSTGEIGYVITGIKDIRQCRVGDTIISEKLKSVKKSVILERSGNGAIESHQDSNKILSRSLPLQDDNKESDKVFIDSNGTVIESLPGYNVPKPMVFFGMYPQSADDYGDLKEGLGKLTLNDTSLTYSDEYSAYLGSGFRVGFLGLLHAEIVKERLKQEFDLDLLLTMPQVLYQKKEDGVLLEPYMLLSVYAPSTYVGAIMAVCQKKKGELLDMTYHESYVVLSYEMPYSMFIRGISAEIKSVSSGFASIDYELTDYKPADLVMLDIRINDIVIDVLSEYVYKEEAGYVARQKAEKLKNSLDRQQFRQIIQAVVNGNIVAREEISPFRKDVLAKMSGGDRTRKDKLLEAQKKGKKKMKTVGKIDLPQEALFSMITEGK